VKRIAFLFPGQGMEVPLMGLAIAGTTPAARHLLELAGGCCGQDLPRLLERRDRALERTDVLQPCLTAVALGAFEALTVAGVRPDLVAGHSLGELAAGAAAGCIAVPSAVELASLRGALMAREAGLHPGGMLALLAVDRSAVDRVLARHAVDLAAHNAPDEWVVSGPSAELRAVAHELPSRPLAVSGAWHGRAMAGALTELARALRALPLGPARARVISNATGAEVSPERFVEYLGGQLTRPVLWAGTMAALATAEITDIVTVGPGRVLRGLVRKNLGQAIRVHTTEDADDLARTAGRLTS
jgi:[acyl-carrier-protein] S-malonyltransferase